MSRGSVQKIIGTNGDISWRVRIEQPPLPDGKRRWTSETFRTKREAEAFRAESVTRRNRGIVDTGARLRLGDYLTDRWLPFYKTQQRPSSYRAREIGCRVHIIPKLGHYKLSQLTPSVVQMFYNELEGSIHPNTIRSIATTLSAALNMAVRWELIYRNPCQGATKPKPVKRPAALWEPEQVQHFLASEPDLDWRCLWATLAVTGMRLGELLALTWDDIDFAHGTLHVRRTMAKGYAGLTINAPKTANGTRAITVHDGLLTLLRATQERQEARHSLATGKPRQLPQNGSKRGNHLRGVVTGINVVAQPASERWRVVFDRGDGFPLTPNMVDHRWTQNLTRSGLPKIRKHDLRHGAATVWLESGIDLKVVSEQLGHSSIQITGDVYAHVTQKLARAAAKVIGERILGIQGEND